MLYLEYSLRYLKSMYLNRYSTYHMNTRTTRFLLLTRFCRPLMIESFFTPSTYLSMKFRVDKPVTFTALLIYVSFYLRAIFAKALSNGRKSRFELSIFNTTLMNRVTDRFDTRLASSRLNVPLTGGCGFTSLITIDSI